MPRGSRVGTRQEILATALELFLSQGYEATSLREIAERLEITKAALYYHFPAKEQLIVELTRQLLNDLADLLAKARAERSRDRDTCRVELLDAYLGLLIEHHQVIDLLARNPATQNHPDVGLRARNLIEALTSELAGPDSTTQDKLRVACSMGAISAVITLPTKDVEAARDVILGAALAALDAGPAADLSSLSPLRNSRTVP